MLGAPAVALGLLTFAGGSDTTLQIGAVVAALAGDELAPRVGELARRPADAGLRPIRRGPATWTASRSCASGSRRSGCSGGAGCS
jgi:hypothetical protein